MGSDTTGIMMLLFNFFVGGTAILGLAYYLQKRKKAHKAFSRKVIFLCSTTSVIAVMGIIYVSHTTFDLVANIVGGFGLLTTTLMLIFKMRFL